MFKMTFRSGEWVEVRTKAEILATLNDDARLDGLPLMPQMLGYCGQRFRVLKVAHKTCDWVYGTKGRRLARGVHLETRCDGRAYGGCQSECLLYWREEWLKKADGPQLQSDHQNAGSQPQESIARAEGDSQSIMKCTEEMVWRATRHSDQGSRYVCQATEVLKFTEPLPWWDVRQYWKDVTCRNVSVGGMLRGLCYAAYTAVMNLGIGLGPPLRWFYNQVQRTRGRHCHPEVTGAIPSGQPTPEADLGLKVGDAVRIRPIEEIRSTMTVDNRNRGLTFDKEMVPYCGTVRTVHALVRRFVDEKSGELVELKRPCIILQDVVCEGRFSDRRMFCPRRIFPWWHDVWLERNEPRCDATDGSPTPRPKPL